jgi:hypothetical protein
MKFLKTLLRIVRSYDQDISTLARHVQGVERDMAQASHFIKEATKLHIDVSIDGSSTVVLCGRYKNKEHVQTFRLPPSEFSKLVEQIQHMSNVGTIETLDMPPLIDATVRAQLKEGV